MVNALTSITTSGTDYGADVTLEWVLPAVLPNHWRLFVFKKAGAAVQDVDIAAYFAGTLDRAGQKSKGIYVFETIPNTASRVTDFTVLSGTDYFYTGVIKDVDGAEFSTSVSTDYTPTPKIVINTLDGKAVVVRGIEKAIDILRTDEGTKLVLEKDVKVWRAYPIEKGVGDFVVVQRTPGRSLVRQLGDVIYDEPGIEVKGETDTDTFEVHWVSVEPLRRDKMTNLFRAVRQVIRYYILQLGNGDVKDARFTMSGDSEGKLFDGTLVYRGVMMIQVDVETQVQIGEAAGPFSFDLVYEYQVEA